MMEYNYMPLWRYVAANTVMIVSFIFSILGSTSIIYLILRDPKKRSEVYHRLVLGMSITDLVFSTCGPFNALLLPKETNMPFAMGNTRTCEFIGAMTVVWLGSIIYNSILCVYFLLTIRYQKRQRQVKALVEPYGHMIAIGLPLLVVILSLATNVFNPDVVFGICIMAPFPANCLHDDSVDCIRGELYNQGIIVHNALNFLIGAVGITSTWLVYWTVRQQEARNQRHSFADAPPSALRQRQTKAVATQAIWYTVAFMNTMFSGLLFVIVGSLATRSGTSHLSENNVVYFCVVIFYMVAPSQGFINWLIYIRPRWYPWRDAYPNRSRWWTLRQIVGGSPTPLTRPTQHWLAVDSPSRDGDTTGGEDCSNVGAPTFQKDATGFGDSPDNKPPSLESTTRVP